jgi:hypothetical protein
VIASESYQMMWVISLIGNIMTAFYDVPALHYTSSLVEAPLQ